MSSNVEKIKEKLDIVEVISNYLKLNKSGSNFIAKCPFHNEKTPSFFVSEARQSYHCFGCDKSGDIFSFVQEIEGCDFKEALNSLALRAGVSLEYERKDTKSDKEDLFSVLNESTNFFEKNLRPAKDIIKYLKDRGLTGSTAKKFRVGFTNEKWNELFMHLKKKGFSEAIMVRAGLVINGDKGYYDRFRGRIMFPITDAFGKVVGFSGRIFGDVKLAKYVNSPDTELYNKSKILFGFDKAKLAIRKENFCILVEGQMDLLMSHQAGIINTVAMSGTALSVHHLTSIGRLTNNIIMAFDKDEAGINASKRGIDTALYLGMDVKVVNMPSGFDPADFILKYGGEKWREEINKSEHIIDFYINVLAEKYSDQREFRVKVGEVVLPYVALLKDKINQAHFITEISRKLGISEEPIWEELRNTIKLKKDIKINEVKKPIDTIKKVHTRTEMIERKIVGILFWQDEIKAKNIDINELKSKYRLITSVYENQNIIDSITETEKKDFIFEAEVYYGNIERAVEALTELFIYLEKEILKKERERIKKDLLTAENKKDTALSDDLLEKYQNISQKINNLKVS